MDSLHQFDYKHAHIDSHVLRKEIQDLKQTIKCSPEYGQITPQSQLWFPWVRSRSISDNLLTVWDSLQLKASFASFRAYKR
jgi:hypothetical protein